jgi:hypothetical protein
VRRSANPFGGGRSKEDLMGWIVFFGVLLVLGALIYRREHRGSRGGFAIRGERGAAAAHLADQELRTANARNLSGGTSIGGGGAPGF